MLFVRIAKEDEGCKYIVTDGTSVLKKIDKEIIDANEEVQVFLTEKKVSDLEKENTDLKTQIQSVSSDLQGFMDFYFNGGAV